MSLIPTPILQLQIQQAALDFVGTIFSGTGFTEDNLESEPENRRQAACLKFSQDVSSAVDAWLNAVVLHIPPGTILTTGVPTFHASTNDAIVLKI